MSGVPGLIAIYTPSPASSQLTGLIRSISKYDIRTWKRFLRYALRAFAPFDIAPNAFLTRVNNICILCTDV